MVMVRIDDAPFTGAVKERIKSMGFKAWDWGHPSVTLSDPIAFFEERLQEVLVVEQAPPVNLPRDSKFRYGNDVPAEAMFLQTSAPRSREKRRSLSPEEELRRLARKK